MADAVVVGAGPNGLVAANLLADAGWDVVVLEAAPEPGGAVRSSDALTVPGFVHDRFSAFYPFAVASPAVRRLELERFGLRWRRAPLVVAHPGGDGLSVVLSQNLDETAASLDADHPGDGEAWRSLYRQWQHVGEDLVEALLSPFPPIRASAAIAAHLRRDLLRFARFAVLPVRRLAEEHFGGRGGAMLLAGNAAHTDIAPEAPLSGFVGWLLCCLGQQHGFPVPEGGAGQLTASMVRRLSTRGGRLVCGATVTEVVIRRGRAVAVRTDDGTEFDARRAVLADVDAVALYLGLVGADRLPPRFVDDLRRFHRDDATVKVDWALSGPIPWTNDAARRAGTLHIADGIDHLTGIAADLATRTAPARPLLLFGQMTLTDPTRSPRGTETAWAYTHLPREIRRDAGGVLTGRWDDADRAAIVARMESIVEEHAPGFRDLVVGRHVETPLGLEAADANLVGGGLNGGTSQLHQQLVFRPTPGLGRPTTPIDGLYLASASAHPGGGVHGACGANAATVALHHDRLRRLFRAPDRQSPGSTTDGSTGSATTGVSKPRHSPR